MWPWYSNDAPASWLVHRRKSLRTACNESSSRVQSRSSLDGGAGDRSRSLGQSTGRLHAGTARVRFGHRADAIQQRARGRYRGPAVPQRPLRWSGPPAPSRRSTPPATAPGRGRAGARCRGFQCSATRRAMTCRPTRPTTSPRKTKNVRRSPSPCGVNPPARPAQRHYRQGQHLGLREHRRRSAAVELPDGNQVSVPSTPSSPVEGIATATKGATSTATTRLLDWHYFLTHGVSDH